MKKRLLPFLLFSLFVRVQAQNTEALVNAEKAFEKACLEKGIRDGFLANVDSNAIIFTARGPENAKKFWLSLPELPGIFSWSASYAEMSNSGNWGYTSGNYLHRKKTLEDTVDDSGQYNTVWHLTEKGEWKYLIDMGVAHPPEPLDEYTKSVLKEKYGSGHNANENRLLETDLLFDSLFEKNIKAAYDAFGSDKYILNLKGHLPATSLKNGIDLLIKIPSNFTFRPVGFFISPGMDLGVVYGTILYGDKSSSYMRIWRHENKGWKIALEVIRI